jgi:transcriptional regulator with XRE-family HTH domain
MTGDAFKRKRIEHHLTQEELGVLIGISRNTVANYEKQGKIPASRLPIIHRVFEKLDKDRQNLISGKDMDALHALYQETESEHLLESILKKFHSVEIVHYIHKHLDQFMAEPSFLMLAKNVVNEQEIDRIKQEIERLDAKFSALHKDKNEGDTSE